MGYLLDAHVHKWNRTQQFPIECHQSCQKGIFLIHIHNTKRKFYHNYQIPKSLWSCKSHYEARIINNVNTGKGELSVSVDGEAGGGSKLNIHCCKKKWRLRNNNTANYSLSPFCLKNFCDSSLPLAPTRKAIRQHYEILHHRLDPHLSILRYTVPNPLRVLIGNKWKSGGFITSEENLKCLRFYLKKSSSLGFFRRKMKIWVFRRICPP